MKGRKSKPTTLKLLEGAQPCRVNASEPKAPAGRPDCPDYLDEVGRAKWGQMIAVLEPMGTLTLAEGEALAIYCGAFSRKRQAEACLAAEGLTVGGAQGGTKTHPALGVVRECDATMIRILTEFGLTPSSRSRVKAQAEGPKDALSELLARRKRDA